MSLRFFSDQCVPAEITETLRRHGHQVTLLREVLPIRSPDPAVIAKARELGAILASLNGDFSDIVAYPPAQHLGIVAIQLHNHPEIIPPLMELLAAFLDGHPAQDFYHGNSSSSKCIACESGSELLKRAMPGEFPYDVFLSHSAKDKRSKPPTLMHDTGGNAVVRDVAERLKRDGLRVWFDEWEIRPGDSIERTQSKTAKIDEGLERSRVLVLCMSANAFGSDWTQLESGTFRFRDPLNKAAF